MINEIRNVQEKVYEVKLKTLQNNLDAIIKEQTDFYIKTIYKLQERIDKAIEYTEREEVNSIGTPYSYTTIGKNLLNILRGEDNEDNE